MSEVDETIRRLLGVWNQLPEQHRNDFTLSFAIIRIFMGLEWLKKHLNPEQKTSGIFKLGEETNEEGATRNYRAIDLAECIVNLRNIDGFDECLSRMREADNPEPGYAELHIARMLCINSWPFRIIKPRGNRGDDYDLEIICHNQTRCGDTKCKLESTELSSTTIEKTLSNSRDQLPPDGPGVFFLKIPQKWMYNPDWERITGQGAVDFFARGTQRVASVVFYVEPLHYRDGTLSQGHLRLEVMNPRHKLSKLFDWYLLERWQPPTAMPNALPPFWIRLSNFPRWIPGYGKDQG